MDNSKNAIRIVECSECLCAHDFICEACKSVDTSTMHSTRSLTFYDDVGNIDFWHCHNCDMWTLTVITDDKSFTCDECKDGLENGGKFDLCTGKIVLPPIELVDLVNHLELDL